MMQLLAAGIIEDTGALAQQLQDLLVGAVMSLLCVGFVISVFVKSRSVLQGLVALLGAAALWFAVMHLVVFRNAVGHDLPTGAAAVTRQVGEIR